MARKQTESKITKADLARREKTTARQTTARQTTNGGLTKIGALWISEGKNGKFFSGRIQLSETEEIRVLVFKNGYKEESKHPDYVIYEPAPEQTQPARRGGPSSDDDIPF